MRKSGERKRAEADENRHTGTSTDSPITRPHLRSTTLSGYPMVDSALEQIASSFLPVISSPTSLDH